MTTIFSILIVFAGSGLGGVCRWVISCWFNGSYPLGTLLANVVGCLFLGIITRLSPGDPQLKLLLATGFCGGFTTFSTFVNENFLMMRGGQLLFSIGYIMLSIILGLMATWAGYNLIK